MSIAKDDILEALGLETGGGFFGPALIGFGVGALVGATVALLLAPKKGSEMREELMGRARDMVGRVEHEMGMGENAPSSEPPRNY